MERTESIIIQVAPNFENLKIGEMERFGWNLQGRQEIHEEGDAYGAPSPHSNTYVIQTRVYQYVKLHFVRSLNLPNLNQIKQVEAEYFNLPFPTSPGMGCASVFVIFGIGCLFMGLFQISKMKGQDLVFLVLFYGGWIALGVFWVKSVLKRQETARQICEQSINRMEELRAIAQRLL